MDDKHGTRITLELDSLGQYTNTIDLVDRTTLDNAEIKTTQSIILGWNPTRISLQTHGDGFVDEAIWMAFVGAYSIRFGILPTKACFQSLCRLRQLWRTSNQMWKSLDFVQPPPHTFNLNC